MNSHELQNFAESSIWPEEWQVVKLGDANITDLIMGQSPPSSTYNNKGTGLPFLQGNAEFGDTYPVPILSCTQPIKIAEKNDILLSVRAPVGDVNINPSKSCIGRGLATIRPKSDKLNYLFLFYYLKFGSKKFESLSMGSTFKAIRKKEVENFQILLPPLPEQRRIAEVLGTVDSAIQKVGGAIERTERLKWGLMQQLLTRGIGHERFKETKVGRVPEEWKVVRLGDKTVVDLIMGQSPPSSTYNNEGIGVPFLQGNAEFTEKYPKPILSCSQPTKLSMKNDILLSVRAPVGDVNIAPYKLCIGRGLAAIKPKSDILEYLFLFYDLKFRNHKFESLSMGSTFKAIRKEEVEKFKIPLPPLPEQHRIAEILSTVDKKLELERRRKEKLERVKKGLMNELLTGRNRVKVG